MWTEYTRNGLTIKRMVNVPRGGVCKFIATDSQKQEAILVWGNYQGGEPSPEDWVKKGLILN